MGHVERISPTSHTRGYIDHAVCLRLRKRKVMFSSFSEQTVVPDRLEVHWVCRRAWGPWEVDSVWLEGPVMTAQGLDPERRDGLLFAVDGAGAEGAPKDAPEWVRRIAQRAGELEPEGRELISA